MSPRNTSLCSYILIAFRDHGVYMYVVRLKMEFRSCARGRCFLGGFPFHQFNWYSIQKMCLGSILSKKIPVWPHRGWRVFNCSMLVHWKNISHPCFMHIYENEILPVKLPLLRMECNWRNYCGCRRCAKQRLAMYSVYCVYEIHVLI